MSQCRRHLVYLHRSGIPAHSVPKVDVGAHFTPSRSSTHGASSSVAQYGMSWLSHLWRINTQVSPSSSRPQKLLSKSSSRGLKYLGRHYWRPPDKLQKVCLHVGSYVVAAGWLNGTLVRRCKKRATRGDWLRGCGSWERDDGLCHGQVDARSSNDVGRGASNFKRETRGGHRADCAGTSVQT